MSKHPYLLEIESDYRRQTYLAEAAADRLAQDAGLDRRGPLHKAVCHGLAGLGHMLIASGRRLEGLGTPSLPQSIPSPEAVTAGSGQS